MMEEAAMQQQMMQDPNMVDMNGQPMMAQDGQQHFIDGQMQGQYTQEQLEVSMNVTLAVV